ncbi:metal-dependent hydrolase [Croceicoccus ponticola]|uniref:Metal-dependent hydrolase n=1 Tax=Croceicoccus ponticola TaxID=2217664 RepID=A0A437H1Q8_9SPHN|nr:metal-dependent hydrolase [Croceicoccus ponticola]RVQ69555.1 metal-dependent hydrolase [Croceicoccus ponticola]
MPLRAITVRDVRFARNQSTARWWLGGDPFATAIFNSLSISFPRGEAYFVESVRFFRDGTVEPLTSEIRDFISQEINHSREHLAFNRTVAQSGYDTAVLEDVVKRVLDDARARKPIVSLAVTMALEHFTAMFAHQLLADPSILAGADPELAELWRWHAIEEIEHKAVAYDTYLSATRDWPRFRRWKLKALLMLLTTRNFLRLRYGGAVELLRQDGITGWRAHWGLLRYAFVSPGMVRRIIPAWIAYFLPGFHPWNHDDRALIAKALSQKILAKDS